MMTNSQLTPSTLTVKTTSHDYPIVVGGCFDPSYIASKQVLIVSNTTIAPLYLPALMACLVEYEPKVCLLPDGESYKTQDSLELIYDCLIRAKFGRECTLIALGGGVIGDMTGFAAASFMRGVAFIQVPTTLLAQVDSSVGGKTGINHRLGKNMIGAFWQPKAVFIDPTYLTTLPKREFCAGMAEVIKYGCIIDGDFLHWLLCHKQDILAQKPSVLTQMIYRACAYKAKIVAQDETEQGIRAILNFGHTFGHAIETFVGYQGWLHGEAVAVGMRLASQLSYLEGRLSQVDYEFLLELLLAFELPIDPPKMTVEQWLELMSRDKKVKASRLTLVVLDGLGQATIIHDVCMKSLKKVLA